MLLWFVSVLLTRSLVFPDIELADLEIDKNGTVWLLPASDPVVIRIDENGEQSRFTPDPSGLPSGLALSNTGRWLVSFRNPGLILEYNSNDILLEKIPSPDTGDVLFSGLLTLRIESASGSVVSSRGDVIGRNCCSSGSRLCSAPDGNYMVSGPSGVFVLEMGEVPVKIADSGFACYAGDRILLLQNGILHVSGGDTLLTDVVHRCISSSPDGETVILWGGALPLVLE